MKEVDFIESYWFEKKNRIHGHLAHDHIPADTIRWFIYCIEDIPCRKQIVGSTVNPRQRWSNYKSSCNSKTSKITGLSKHFSQWEGCPNDPGRQKETIRFTLIDFYIKLIDFYIKLNLKKPTIVQEPSAGAESAPI